MALLKRFLVLVACACICGCGGNGPTNPTSTPPTPPQPTIYDTTTPGITLPTVVREVRPQYTAAALAARIQGTVLTGVIVWADGTVGDVTVIRSLDTVYGLDEEAITAAKQWLFNPALLNNRPVAIRITIEFTFTVK